MKKILPFSIIFKDTNIDFNFVLHDQTVNSEHVGKIASILINEIDKEIKKKPKYFRRRSYSSSCPIHSYKNNSKLI